MHFYNAALASEVEGTAQKHFWTAQPPFFEGIIEHEVPMDPHQGLGWEGKLWQSFGLNGYGTSASLLLTCICTSAALLSDNGGSGLRQTHTNCIDVNTPDYVGLASTAFNMSARTVCKQQR